MRPPNDINDIRVESASPNSESASSERPRLSGLPERTQFRIKKHAETARQADGRGEGRSRTQLFDAGRILDDAEPTGRPTRYTEELADEMCLQMAKGASLITICAREGMPVLSTILLWLAKDDEFRTKVGRARELRADIHAEEVLVIADNSGVNEFELDGKTRKVIIERAKLMIETRLRLMALMNPMKYGPRAAITVTGNMSLEQMITATLDAPRPPPPQMIEGRAEEQPTRVDNEGEEL